MEDVEEELLSRGVVVEPLLKLEERLILQTEEEEGEYKSCKVHTAETLNNGHTLGIPLLERTHTWDPFVREDTHLGSLC